MVGTYVHRVINAYTIALSELERLKVRETRRVWRRVPKALSRD